MYPFIIKLLFVEATGCWVLNCDRRPLWDSEPTETWFNKSELLRFCTFHASITLSRKFGCLLGEESDGLWNLMDRLRGEDLDSVFLRTRDSLGFSIVSGFCGGGFCSGFSSSSRGVSIRLYFFVNLYWYMDYLGLLFWLIFSFLLSFLASWNSTDFHKMVFLNLFFVFLFLFFFLSQYLNFLSFFQE